MGYRWLMVAVVGAGCGRLHFDALPADAMTGPTVLFPFETDSTVSITDTIGGLVGQCVPPGCPVQVPGHHGLGYHFDGNDCIKVADAPALRPDHLTISLWVDIETEGNRSIVSKVLTDVSGFADSWQLETGVTPLQPLDAVSFTTNHGGATNELLWSADHVLVLNEWQHFAATWDGSQKLVYCNGVLVASSPPGLAPIPYDARNLSIGCDENANGNFQYITGALDELELYDEALTADQIAALAAS